MRRKKTENYLGLAVVSAAVLITAWKGSVDYLALALVAILFKLPGTRRIATLFSKHEDDSCNPR